MIKELRSYEGTIFTLDLSLDPNEIKQTKSAEFFKLYMFEGDKHPIMTGQQISPWEYSCGKAAFEKVKSFASDELQQISFGCDTSRRVYLIEKAKRIWKVVKGFIPDIVWISIQEILIKTTLLIGGVVIAALSSAIFWIIFSWVINLKLWG